MTDIAEYRLPRSARPRPLRAGVDSRSGRVALLRRRWSSPWTWSSRSRALVCNAAELDIKEARLETPSGAVLDGRVDLDEAAQRATIAFDTTVAPASGYRLHLRFTGILNDQLHGFYRSTFSDDDGAEHVIAVTQFEPADARRAFPCWDEPDFKAIFAVTLVVDDELTALSNASVASEEPAGGGRRRVAFQRNHGDVDLPGGLCGGSFRAHAAR